MKDWYLATGSPYYITGENEDFNAYKGAFEEAARSLLGAKMDLCENRITQIPRHCHAIMQNKTNDSIDSTGARQLLTSIGTMQDICYVYHDKEWYIAASDTDNQGWYEKTVLWRTNVDLKFVSPVTGEVVMYPVYMTNSTKYSSGEAVKSQLTIESSQFRILIPANDETIEIRNGTRFLVDLDKKSPTAWKVSQVDTITCRYKTRQVLSIMAVADEFNPAFDDPEEMVANRYGYEDRLEDEGTPPPTPEETEGSLWD